MVEALSSIFCISQCSQNMQLNEEAPFKKDLLIDPSDAENSDRGTEHRTLVLACCGLSKFQHYLSFNIPIPSSIRLRGIAFNYWLLVWIRKAGKQEFIKSSLVKHKITQSL